ncbi:MAG: hypothetical protein MMC33_004598 [Icmadophila ericetorum]|nr:hypothetical protein [Icmadophila ericetorum]
MRETLIDIYFCNTAAAKQDPDNADCLVRVYLGENESHHHCSSYDSHRNFLLRLNMLSTLSLDPILLVTGMAITLATIHRQAQIDGTDIEFVLVSAHSPTVSTDRRRAYVPIFNPALNTGHRQPPALYEIHKVPDIIMDPEITNSTKPSHSSPPTTTPQFSSSLLLYVLDFENPPRITPTLEDVDTKLVPAFLRNDPYYPRPDID